MVNDFFKVARALGSRTRFAVFQALGEQGATASELARQFGVTVPAIAAHLKQLRQAGIVEAHRHGRRHVHRWRRGERLALVVQRVRVKRERDTPMPVAGSCAEPP